MLLKKIITRKRKYKVHNPIQENFSMLLNYYIFLICFEVHNPIQESFN